jgi:hypothetical protein
MDLKEGKMHTKPMTALSHHIKKLNIQELVSVNFFDFIVIVILLFTLLLGNLSLIANIFFTFILLGMMGRLLINMYWGMTRD